MRHDHSGGVDHLGTVLREVANRGGRLDRGAIELKKRVIQQLCRDRKNIYPGSGKEINFESKGRYGPEGSPLTEELRKRWSHNLEMLKRAGVKIEAGDRDIAQSQEYLSDALEELYALAPSVVQRMSQVYHEQASDRELERIQEVAARSGPNAKDAAKTLVVHDFGIEALLYLLRRNEHLEGLTARFAERMTVRRQEQMEERHDEIYRVYRTFRDDGYGKTAAVNETVLTYRTVKLEELAASTVWRILSIREGAGDNDPPSRRRMKRTKSKT